MSESLREKTCCFTGHRVIPARSLPALAKELEQTLRCLIGAGVRYFGAGGALGFDTLAAETVLRLKGEYPGIRLILVLPCRDQTRGWREADVRRYRDILSRRTRWSTPPSAILPAACTDATAIWWKTVPSAWLTAPARQGAAPTRHSTPGNGGCAWCCWGRGRGHPLAPAALLPYNEGE